MKVGKGWNSALHPPPLRTCFQHVAAQDGAKKGRRELTDKRKSCMSGQLCPKL